MKNLFKIFSMLSLLVLSACTDYVQQMKDDHDEWEKEKGKYADWDSNNSSSSGVVDPSALGIGTLYDDRDGDKYGWVEIGSQTWMTENLRYDAEGSFCYEESKSNCFRYGRLYTWAAAVGKSEKECGPGKDCPLPSLVRGVCPSGWRLPSREDYEILFDAVGGMEIAGKRLKASYEWEDAQENDGAYSFEILPGGYSDDPPSSLGQGKEVHYWTSSAEVSGYATGIWFQAWSEWVLENIMLDRSEAYYVRCIKGEADDETPVSSSSDEFVNEYFSSSSLDYSGLFLSSSSETYSSDSYGDYRGDLWCGGDAVYRVETDLDAGGDVSGFWFDFTDVADGGNSYITWPVSRGNVYTDNAFDPVIDECAGMCGTFLLNEGTMTYEPFVGIGFNVAGCKDISNCIDMLPADVSAWGGVCVVYSSDVGVIIEMGLGDKGDSLLGYDMPSVTLPKSSGTVTMKEVTWNKFQQAGWGKGTISGEDAATQLVALKFKFQARSGTKGEFNIKSVGRYGSCQPW